jgi:hypothetical protein
MLSKGLVRLAFFVRRQIFYPCASPRFRRLFARPAQRRKSHYATSAGSEPLTPNMPAKAEAARLNAGLAYPNRPLADHPTRRLARSNVSEQRRRFRSCDPAEFLSPRSRILIPPYPPMTETKSTLIVLWATLPTTVPAITVGSARKT